MPRYDYGCSTCGKMRRDVNYSNWREATDYPVTCDCGARMEKVPSAGSFVIKGYNAANHYGTKK